MSILINKHTNILVQGITGSQASFHVKRSLEYGTNIVGGVTPGKGGVIHLGLPVFNNVCDAVKETKATASVMFVPAPYVVGAVEDALDAGIELIVCIADSIPVLDMVRIKDMLKGTNTKFIGPNTPGIITPGEARMGIFPENIHKSGNIGVVSRSSTLTYEAVIEVSRAGLGQSTVVGLGDDMVIGSDFVDVVDMFMQDDNTKAIVAIGTLGGMFEEHLAEYYKKLKKKKPIIGFIAGGNSYCRYSMGYADDIITYGYITTQDKKNIMSDSGIIMVDHINYLHDELNKLCL